MGVKRCWELTPTARKLSQQAGRKLINLEREKKTNNELINNSTNKQKIELMKKSYFILAAIASVALASCTNDDLSGGDQGSPTRPIAINFGSQFTAFTRADFTGAAAAEKLGNQFVVTGYKGNTTATTSTDKVFDNYLVEWAENTANNTESNTNNWEYVGKGTFPTSGATKQTIKYWDYNAAQYDFIAYSLGGKLPVIDGTDLDAWHNPVDGKIEVSAINPATATATTGAYTLRGKVKDLASCYIADIVTVKKDDYDNGPVTIRFRNLNTKVRIGLYENIPGYDVKSVKFYTSSTATTTATDGKAYLYTSTGNRICLSTAEEVGTMTVYYPTVDNPGDPDNNKAHVNYSSMDGNNYASFGAFGDETIGTSSSNATYAGDGYAIVLPNESGDKLILRVDYTLVSEDGSNEVITVSSASAEIPAIYSEWQAGYAYTYIFKISPNTNGTTGTPSTPGTTDGDPAGLYPITFDAAVIQDIEGIQETITTVAEPSITTYQNGLAVTDEFIPGSLITVMVQNFNSETPAALTDKAFLYTIPDGMTEKEVLAALEYQEDDAAAGTIKGRNNLVLTEAAGLSIDGTKATFTPAALVAPETQRTYAFIYKIKEGTQTAKYEPVTFAPGADVTDAVNTNERFYCDYKYVDKNGTDAQDGEIYYSYDNDNDKYTVAAQQPTFFGQIFASGLYFKAGPNDYRAHTTVVETDGKYYIRTGFSSGKDEDFTEVGYIKYEDFASAELYITNIGEGTLKNTDEPGEATTYYQRSGNATDGYTFTRCVILPQQINNLFIRTDSGNKELCPAGEKAVAGKKYYDRYWWYNGAEYAVKVIKVQ